MKRTVILLITAMVMGVSGLVVAQDKPDCSEKKQAISDAKAELKAAKKPDLSSCKGMKGKEKKACIKPLKAAAKDAGKAAKGKMKEAKHALVCCKKPTKKGC